MVTGIFALRGEHALIEAFDARALFFDCGKGGIESVVNLHLVVADDARRRSALARGVFEGSCAVGHRRPHRARPVSAAHGNVVRVVVAGAPLPALLVAVALCAGIAFVRRPSPKNVVGEAFTFWAFDDIVTPDFAPDGDRGLVYGVVVEREGHRDHGMLLDGTTDAVHIFVDTLLASRESQGALHRHLYRFVHYAGDRRTADVIYPCLTDGTWQRRAAL